jgi:acetyl-CoA decarbonylase/synthase complex subunit alpha
MSLLLCGRCEQECERELPLMSILAKVGEKLAKTEKFNIRAGRGPVQDVENSECRGPTCFR